MTRFRSTLVSLCLALALGFAAGPVLAKSATLPELLANLRKALVPAPAAPAATPGTPGATPAALPNQAYAAAGRVVDQAESMINQGRLAEAEQTLGQLRVMMTADNPKAATALDQVIAAVHAQAAEAIAKQEATYNALEQDFIAKFNSKAPAPAFDALLQQIAAVAPTGGNNYGSPAAQKLETLRNFVTRWQDYLLQSAAGNTQQAAQIMSELMQQAARLPLVPRSQLATIAAEATARANAANPQLDVLRKKLTALIDSAKSAADFDALLAELPRPVNNGYNANNGQVEQLRRMITRWQDYYSQLDSGTGPAAQNLLRELVNDPNIELYYPRSKILARINGAAIPPPPAASAVSAKPADNPDATDPFVPPEKLTLATLDQFARQISARRLAPPPGAEDIYPEVNRLRAVAQQLRVGNAQAAFAGLNTTTGNALRWGTYADALFAVQQQLLTRIFALLINAPPAVQPTDGEFFERYLARVWQYGREQKDWALIYRLLVTNGTVVRTGYNNGENSDLQSYRQFFAGLQQEKAGLWAAAARSYMGALRASGPNLPAEEIGARLAEIKAAHPEEYTNAEKFPFGEGTMVANPRNLGYGVDPRTNLPFPPPNPGPAPLPPTPVPVPAAVAPVPPAK